MNKKTIAALIEEHSKEYLTPREKRLAHLAWFDLVFGPLTGCDVCGVDTLEECTCEVKWPGFQAACKELRNADIPSELWIDTNAECIVEVPNLDVDSGEEYMYCARKYIKRVLFGDVAEYI